MVEDQLEGARAGPEFRESIMREISRVEVRPEKSPQDHGRVLLLDKDGRCLTIIIGKAEEHAIHRAVTGERPPRPLTHELFLSALESFGISVKEARVTGLQEGTFFGALVLERAGEEHVVDSRPSDAVALAMMTGARVTVAEEVMRRGGAQYVRSEADLEKIWEGFVVAGPEQFDQDLVELCERLLELSDAALAKVVEKVGATAVGTALAAMSETVEEKPGWKEKVVALTPTIKPEARQNLPEDVAQALDSLLAKLERAGIRIDADSLPRRLSAERVIEARKAIRAAFGQVTKQSGTGC